MQVYLRASVIHMSSCKEENTSELLVLYPVFGNQKTNG